MIPFFVAASLLIVGQVPQGLPQELPLSRLPIERRADVSLLAAIRKGDLAAVKAAIARDIDVDATTKEGRTPLMITVEKGNIRIVQLLLDHHAQVYGRSESGETPLSIALRQRNDAIIKLLLAKGGNVGFFEHDKKMPLLVWVTAIDDVASVKILIRRQFDPHSVAARGALAIAAGYGYREIVTLLLAQGVTPNRKAGEEDSILVTAARVPNPGQERIVRKLLEAKATVDQTDSQGTTALMAAAEAGNAAIIQVLLTKGANTKLKDKAGRDAITYAREGQRQNIVALLQKMGEGGTAVHRSDKLFAAVEKANLIAVQTALREGADANAFDAEGYTPLMKAAMKGHAAIMECLLAAGAKVDTQDLQSGRHYTAMLWAAEEDKPEAIRVLASHHANPNIAAWQGWTALGRAAGLASATTVKALLDAGADIKPKDDLGEMALMQAATYGRTENARILLDRGAHVDAKNRAGNTALWWAANNGFVETLTLLLERGASVDLQGGLGRTPLLTALEEEHTDIAKILLAHKADVNLADKSDHTPLMVAAEKGDIAIVRLLLEKGAEINQRDRIGIHPGKTALGYAQENKHVDVIAVLKQAGRKL